MAVHQIHEMDLRHRLLDSYAYSVVHQRMALGGRLGISPHSLRAAIRDKVIDIEIQRLEALQPRPGSAAARRLDELKSIM